MFLFMILWMTLFHNRWKNMRNYLKRTNSPESVIYLSGFLILFALILTALGNGFDTSKDRRRLNNFISI